MNRDAQSAQLRIDVEPPDSSEARWCLEQYFSELAARFDAGFDPARADHASLDDYAAPRGAFLVARLDGRPVGCGALRTIDADIGEVKRVWVAAGARGRGIASRILGRLEAAARARGLTMLRLDSNRALIEAHALYRKLGFVEVAPFNDDPYAHHWFQKWLV